MLNVASIKTDNISFKSLPPRNYKEIDEFVSRSAQPTEDHFKWLKEQGVTDVINFRTMVVPGVDFNEPQIVKNLGMNYHSIPVTERDLNEEKNVVYQKVLGYFNIIDLVKKNGGKAHSHCKAGADRTGFFALLYKSRSGIDTFEQNAQEMIEMGHNQKIYPNVINYAKKIIQKFKKQ